MASIKKGIKKAGNAMMANSISLVPASHFDKIREYAEAKSHPAQHANLPVRCGVACRAL